MYIKLLFYLEYSTYTIIIINGHPFSLNSIPYRNIKHIIILIEWKCSKI